MKKHQRNQHLKELAFDENEKDLFCFNEKGHLIKTIKLREDQDHYADNKVFLFNGRLCALLDQGHIATTVF